MKYTAVFCLIALAACASAAPPADQEAQVLRFDSDVHPEGYQYGWETSDGKKATEEGQLKNVGTEHEALSVHGSYSYVGDDGQTYTVNYIADENGFQPEGAHLPRVA